MTKLIRSTLVATLAAGAAVAVAAPAASAAPASLTSLVNPFVGTENFGNTFPGASAPFGMVQVSPDTGGQGGYDYKGTKIHGFSQTHLSGVGCGVVGELPVMPVTGAVTSGDYQQYASPFSHDDETATPGYYRVGLSKYGIDAEVTATDRTGWQRYTFPTGDRHNVILNTGVANMPVKSSSIRVVDDRTLTGTITDGGFCAGHDVHTVHFVATFSTPFTSHGALPGTGNTGQWVGFGSTKQVTLKVGLSYTGVAGAQANLRAETGTGFDFDATRAALTKRWEGELSRATVSGGSHERQVAYYTALYHALLHPNLAGDVDGRYFGWDKKVHQADGYTPRANYSLWDTYRTQNQLLEILRPDVARDNAMSLLSIGREGGWLPRWALANSETNIMTGDPVTPTLVELWSKGFLKGHEAEAYSMLKKYVTQLPPKGSQFSGRAGNAYYQKLGYIPSGLDQFTDCPNAGGDNDCNNPASATLEYSAADAALSQMAAALGKKADATMLAERGRWYRNLWDSQRKVFHPRSADGTFVEPYDPVGADMQFHEGGAYQYGWLVPQDVPGLAALHGGRAGLAKAMDTFFAYDKVLANPAKAAEDDWISAPYDYYAKPTYNPNNEPDLLAPYLYAWTGQPSKTATVVRAAYTLFTTGADGMTGNDDLGQMSAWYVMSSLGIYPTMSGQNTFVLSSPQFASATVKVGAYDGRQGGTLRVGAPNVSDANRYVRSVRVNGSTRSQTWVPWSALARGGSLDVTVGSKPSSWGTAESAAPPSIDTTASDDRVAFGARASGASAAVGATKVTVSASMVGQWPGDHLVTTSIKAPSGWQADPVHTTKLVSSDGLPAEIDRSVSLTIPKGTAAGSYPVVFTLRAYGVRDITKTVQVQLQDVSCRAAGSSCALDLAGSVTRDGTATVAKPDDGNFDDSGWAYDAALLPLAGAKTIAGTPWLLPNPAGTAKNFVSTAGQQLALPTGSYSSLRVLGAAHGAMSSSASVTYTDGTSASVPFVLGDWAASDPATGNTVGIAMDHRIKNGQGTDGPPVKLWVTSLKLDGNRTVQSITLPNAGGEIYAMTLAK